MKEIGSRLFLTVFPHVYQCFPRDMNKNDGYHFDIFGNQPCLQGPHHYIMPCMRLDDFTHGVFGTKLFENLKALSTNLKAPSD